MTIPTVASLTEQKQIVVRYWATGLLIVLMWGIPNSSWAEFASSTEFFCPPWEGKPRRRKYKLKKIQIKNQNGRHQEEDAGHEVGEG